jgi:hypothetical protein
MAWMTASRFLERCETSRIRRSLGALAGAASPMSLTIVEMPTSGLKALVTKL